MAPPDQPAAMIVAGASPRVVQEAECVTRRTKVHDPRSGQTVIRRERNCR
jgi:hypothetical protein